MIDKALDGFQGFLIDQIGFIQDDHVREFDLLRQKVGDRARIIFGRRLIDTLQVFTD